MSVKKKKLVVYYSLSGNTKRAAETIAEQLSADLLRLKPVSDIPRSGYKKYYVGGKMAFMEKTTELEDFGIDLEVYDQIILGTPVWAFKPVPAVNKFVELLNDKTKVVGVFTLSGGGSDYNTLKVLSKKLTNIKYSRALADRSNRSLAATNKNKIDTFIEGLKTL